MSGGRVSSLPELEALLRLGCEIQLGTIGQGRYRWVYIEGEHVAILSAKPANSDPHRQTEVVRWILALDGSGALQGWHIDWGAPTSTIMLDQLRGLLLNAVVERQSWRGPAGTG